MTLALLCSGQGPQHAGMFALTGDAPEAAHLFAHATALLDSHDPRALVLTGPRALLHQNRAGQILCTLQALAAAAILRDAMPDRMIVAGYSIGELAAWGVAGRIAMADVLDLADDRAAAMDAATSPGDGMLFVRGLTRHAIDGLCARREVAVAIVNPNDGFVLGGSGASLDVLANEAMTMNARRVVRLDVAVASHTPLLASASIAFRRRLDRLAEMRAPHAATRLLSGIDGLPVLSTETGLDKLAAQISQTVQWADCLEACIEAGATSFLELGPGSALSEMVAAAYPGVATRSIEDFRTIDGARAWLARHEPVLSGRGEAAADPVSRRP